MCESVKKITCMFMCTVQVSKGDRYTHFSVMLNLMEQPFRKDVGQMICFFNYIKLTLDRAPKLPKNSLNAC